MPVDICRMQNVKKAHTKHDQDALSFVFWCSRVKILMELKLKNICREGKNKDTHIALFYAL